MTRDFDLEATSRARRHALRALLAAALVATLILPLGCKGNASGSGCQFFADGIDFELEVDDERGFDDFSSTGASLGVAVMDDGDFAGLVIATRFTAVTTERTFEPTCNTNDAIGSYAFGDDNDITDDIADDYPLIAQALTDTAGILGMQHTMNALLVTFDATNGLRYFLAVSGSITLRRTLGVSSENRITGSLDFVEITDLDDAAGVFANGDTVRIDDIDFTYETVDQPS